MAELMSDSEAGMEPIKAPSTKLMSDEEAGMTPVESPKEPVLMSDSEAGLTKNKASTDTKTPTELKVPLGPEERPAANMRGLLSNPKVLRQVVQYKNFLLKAEGSGTSRPPLNVDSSYIINLSNDDNLGDLIRNSYMTNNDERAKFELWANKKINNKDEQPIVDSEGKSFVDSMNAKEVNNLLVEYQDSLNNKEKTAADDKQKMLSERSFLKEQWDNVTYGWNSASAAFYKGVASGVPYIANQLTQGILGFKSKELSQMQKDIEKVGDTFTPDIDLAPKGVFGKTVAGLAGAPIAIAQYLPAIKAVGAVKGMAAIDALSHAKEGFSSSANAAAKGAMMGKMLTASAPLGLGSRATAMGTVGAVMSDGEWEDIVAGAATMAVLAIPGPARGQTIGGAYRNVAEPIWKSIQNSKVGEYFSVLKSLEGKQDYLGLRGKTMGKGAQADKIEQRIGKSLETKNEVHGKQVFDFMTERGAKPEMIKDVKLRQAAVSAKALIRRVGKELERRGVLKEESRVQWEGRYLPRVYLKHILKGEDGFGSKGVYAGYAIERMNLSKEQRAELGEITDASYLSAKAVAQPIKDMISLDFMEKVALDPRWSHEASVIEWKGKATSIYELKKELDSLNERSKYLEGDTKVAVDKQAIELETSINPKLKELEITNLKDFRKVPDTAAWGRLRGMYVRKEIYSDVIEPMTKMPENASFVQKMWDSRGYGSKFQSMWKTMKVPMNIPTQARNFISNGILMHLSGTPMTNIPVLLGRAIAELSSNGKYWRIAKKNGIGQSGFAAVETYKIDINALNLLKKESITSEGADLAAIAKFFSKGVNSFGELYQLSESLWKTAKIIDGMERQGLSAEKASLAAQEALFDYSFVPKNLRDLRSVPLGMPFATFQYKVFPRLLETAIVRPHKFLPYIMLPHAMAAAIKGYYDISDEDYNSLKNSLPIWLQDKMHGMMLPGKDKYGRWQSGDLGYHMPWGMYTSAARNLYKGNIGKAFTDTGLFAGPIPEIIINIGTNVDSFTGREIVNENDPPSMKMKAMMTYIWKYAAPNWVTDSGAAGKILESLNGTTDQRTGLPKLTLTQSMFRLIGLNITPFTPAETARSMRTKTNIEIRETEKRMKSKLRKIATTNVPGEDKAAKMKDTRDAYILLIREKQAKLRQFFEENKFSHDFKKKHYEIVQEDTPE